MLCPRSKIASASARRCAAGESQRWVICRHPFHEVGNRGVVECVVERRLLGRRHGCRLRCDRPLRDLGRLLRRHLRGRRRAAAEGRGRRRLVARDHLGGLGLRHGVFAGQPLRLCLGPRADSLDALQQIARLGLEGAAGLRRVFRQGPEHRGDVVERQVVRDHRVAHNGTLGGKRLQRRLGLGLVPTSAVAQELGDVRIDPWIGGIRAFGQGQHVARGNAGSAGLVDRDDARVRQPDGERVLLVAVDVERDTLQRVAGDDRVCRRDRGACRHEKLRTWSVGGDQRIGPHEVGRTQPSRQALGRRHRVPIGVGCTAAPATPTALDDVRRLVRRHLQAGRAGEADMPVLGGGLRAEAAHRGVDGCGRLEVG